MYEWHSIQWVLFHYFIVTPKWCLYFLQLDWFTLLFDTSTAHLFCVNSLWICKVKDFVFHRPQKKKYMAESPLYWKQLNSIRFCVCGVPHPLDWHTLYMNHRNMIEMYFTFNCNLFAFEFHSSAKSMTSERAVFIMDSSFRFNDCFFFVSFAIQLITILPNLRNIYLFDTHIMTPVNCESFCL